MKTRIRSITERVVAYGFILLALGLLLYFLGSVNRAAKQEISSKQNELLSMQHQLEDAKKEFASRREQISAITQDLAERRKEVREKFENLLEKEGNYTVFIEQVQRKARALDINISDSKYQQPTTASGAGANYQEFQFDLKISGAYHNIKQFLWETENSLQRLVRISKLEIIPPLADDKGHMRMNITLSTFFVP